MMQITKATEHDKVAVRLTQILLKLNQGEKLDPHQLADEFKVTLRTIQRDLLERFSYLPLKKDNGLFSLELFYLGKLNAHDVERFACLAGVKALFPVLKDDFLRELTVKEAIEVAFVDNRTELTTERLINVIDNTHPLKVVMKDKVKEYEDKFKNLKIKAAS